MTVLALAVAPPLPHALAHTAAPDPQGLAGQLGALALERGLDRSVAWLLLGHWQPTATGGWRSEADGGSFFLAEDGRSDPRSELLATLAALYERPGAGDEHAQCRFPARAAWLAGELPLAGLPRVPCPALAAWLAVMEPGPVHLVFADMFMSAPASMYGHTFLRVDRRSAPGVAPLAHIVNYAAHPTTFNVLLYPLLGLLGGFAGRFAAMPYYVKLQEYSNHEARDLWEYELALDRGQALRLLLHAWELDQTYFDYYFLDENCSYHILSLIEVATWQPLRAGFTTRTVPIDTLKLLAGRPDLLRARRYRPSLTRVAAARWALLSAAEAALAHALADPPAGPSSAASDVNDLAAAGLSALANERQALVLEASHDLLRQRWGYDPTGGLADASSEVLAHERRLLAARARVAVPAPEPAVPAPAPPEGGHGSTRLALGAGWYGGSWAQRLGWRPAYHDVLDRGPGFVPGAGIAFFDLTLRLALRAVSSPPASPGAAAGGWWRAVRLERLDLFSATSLTPWAGPRRPLSWRAALGVGEARGAPTGEWRSLAVSAVGGPGLTFDSRLLGHELWYAFADVDLAAGPAFERRARAAVGLSAGVVSQLAAPLTLQLEGGAWLDLWGRVAHAWPRSMADSGRWRPRPSARAGLNLALDRDTALRWQAALSDRERRVTLDLLLYWSIGGG